MKQPKFYLGLDVSKLSVDAALLQGEEVIYQSKISNSKEGLTDLFKIIRSDYKCCKQNTCICAENMGIYNTFLCETSKRKRFNLYLESALRIKRSLGIQRGKNDALDAVRIAKYANQHFRQLKLWEGPRLEINQLKSLSRLRFRLKKARVMILNSNKNDLYFLSKTANRAIKSHTQKTIKALDSEIKSLDNEMDKITGQDTRLKELMTLVTSVPRISNVIARSLIVFTNEFTYFDSPRNLASYCGVAPFEWTSGTSVRGKTRVSKIGNKEMKRLLHLASMGIVKDKKGFLFQYYERKVKEGKNKMSILNAIRNKLLHRICACVRDGIPFKELNRLSIAGSNRSTKKLAMETVPIERDM